MKRRSGAQLRRYPAAPDREALLPEERPSDKPASGVARSQARPRPTMTLGAALDALERRIEVPPDVEDRLVAFILQHRAAEQSLPVLEDVEPRTTRVVRAHRKAARRRAALRARVVRNVRAHRKAARRRAVLRARIAGAALAVLAFAALLAALAATLR
jgi:hypothetical protein